MPAGPPTSSVVVQDGRPTLSSKSYTPSEVPDKDTEPAARGTAVVDLPAPFPPLMACSEEGRAVLQEIATGAHGQAQELPFTDTTTVLNNNARYVSVCRRD